jgi:DNA invertase Pin-like site-specific DNA recombinase
MPPRTKARRCAIYTRKSSEEGLEQGFNSLDAQREACEAFIQSQRHEGWVVIPHIYDDGGFSGGTMERPALQQLLSDIEQREVDIVVVYKVDRLTRALADFAKIVDVFDAQGVSFVSVTQQFNTTTSMGRLTLNILLSFAQFEREVTGERIRDKFLASRKKGLWMGGHPPLGYDIADRCLIVNETEAALVCRIFTRYAETGCVKGLRDELTADGVVSKRRISNAGIPFGGKPLTCGALYKSKSVSARAACVGAMAPMPRSRACLPVSSTMSWAGGSHPVTRLSGNAGIAITSPPPKASMRPRLSTRPGGSPPMKSRTW